MIDGRTTNRTKTPGLKLAALVPALIVLLAATTLVARAQVNRPETVDTLSKSLVVQQQLDNQVDLNATFTNSDGREVRLGDLFDEEKPVILTLVYYGCPMLCGQVLNGVVRSLKKVDLQIGDDYQIVSVSFNPSEDADLAAKKKRSFVRLFHDDGAKRGWNFLTSDSASVRKLANSVGFKYYWDDKTNQYAHSAAIMLLTPDGRVSKYFFGVDFDSRDMRLGLVDASEGKIGSLTDKLLLLCYQYDPATGKYAFVAPVLMGSGILTLVLLGGFIVRSITKERKTNKQSE
jgi:protein SCO1/2